MTVALITGGSGFVGTWLQGELKTTGFEVYSFDHELNVTDYEKVKHVLDEIRPDVVYHLAALSHVGDSFLDPLEVINVNSIGTFQVVRAVCDLNLHARVVIASSAEVYGRLSEEELPVNEAHPIRPISPYGAAKAAGELLALHFFYGSGIEVLIARPFNHIGPGQSDRFVVSALAKRLILAKANGDKKIMVGNLSSRRDYTDVRDIVRAYRLLYDKAKTGEVYNFASDCSISVAEVLNHLKEILDFDVEIEVDQRLIRPLDVPVLRGSYQKLKNATGWEPQISLIDTLKDVVSYWQSKLS